MQANIPQELQPLFTFTGQVDVADLYRYTEQADFFLPLLDSGIAAHERYVTTGVTGPYQLILGFQQACLIDKKFAAFYSFSCANSIIYSDLKTGMQEAISISDSDYPLLQRNIKELAGELEKQSLENFKKNVDARRRLKIK